MDNSNILSICQFYRIISDKTGRVYLDKDGSCYFFDVKAEAEKFASTIGNCSLSKYESLTPDVFYREFYLQGVKNIMVNQHNKELIKLPVTRDKLSKNMFINHHTNFLLTRLKQTGKNRYIRELKPCRLIIPVKLDAREKKMFPMVHYCYAVNGDNKYFCFFSTLQEFEQWRENNGNDWLPLEVEFDKIKRIRKNYPIFINPLSDKIILTNNQILKALSKE